MRMGIEREVRTFDEQEGIACLLALHERKEDVRK